MWDVAAQLEKVIPAAMIGSVAQTSGLTVSAAGFPAPVGAVAEIERHGGPPLRAEVVGFRDHLTVLYPLGRVSGIRRGNRVRLARTAHWLRVGDALRGRVIDAAGEPVDGRPEPALPDRAAFDRAPPHPCRRPRIQHPIATGVRSIDGLLTCGKGQRLGVFSGSGVGKSVLLGMMARYSSADVIVIALIGERGREVNEFIERDLGAQGLAKSVVVVATSDEPAIRRVQAASTATAVAEHFRDRGRSVLLLMDSLTRFAFAQREIGLAAGEPPTTRGYPPSVFAALPRLVERAGQSPQGSITAFYSVLVEADDPNEPISDAVRGLLDGHVWLARRLASRGHYPAVDVLESLSRLMPDVTDNAHQDAARAIREIQAAWRDHEDLISVGAYRRGSNVAVDLALDMQNEINSFLRQRVDEPATLAEARDALMRMHQRIQQSQSAGPPGAPPQHARAPGAAQTPAPGRVAVSAQGRPGAQGPGTAAGGPARNGAASTRS